MIKVSKMTGKLEGLSGINTNPLTNLYCQKMRKNPSNICNQCYSCSMLKSHRKGCVHCWEANGRKLSKGVLKFIPQINTTMCRFHAHGELINRRHYENLCLIARANPRTTFSLFTKRIDLVNAEIAPENMVLVYSNPKIDFIRRKPPEGFDIVFNVVTDGWYNCRMSCFKCGLCYKKGGEQCIVELLR